MSFQDFSIQKDLEDVLSDKVSGYICFSTKGVYSEVLEVPKGVTVLDFSFLKDLYLNRAKKFLLDLKTTTDKLDAFKINVSQLSGEILLEAVYQNGHTEKLHLFPNSQYAYALDLLDEVYDLPTFFKTVGYPTQDIYIPKSMTVTGMHQLGFYMLDHLKLPLQTLKTTDTFYSIVVCSESTTFFNETFLSKLTMSEELHAKVFYQANSLLKELPIVLSKLTDLSDQATLRKLVRNGSGMETSDSLDFSINGTSYDVTKYLMSINGFTLDMIETVISKEKDLYPVEVSILREYAAILKQDGSWMPIAMLSAPLVKKEDGLYVKDFKVKEPVKFYYEEGTFYDIDYGLSNGEILSLQLT